MEGHFLTDRGQVRSHNEDSGGMFENANGQVLAVIADGMGGHQAGDVASQLATSMIKEKWLASKALVEPEKAEEWLINTLSEVNQSIYSHSLEKEECRGMGTTVVIAICTEEFITIAHIGDSRCYLFNESGFHQITEDHSLVNELVRSGEISRADAQHHPRKNIVLKALGTEEYVTADVQTLTWEQGDRLLLCSDGLTDKVSDDELAQMLEPGQEIKQTGQDLINLANERGGEDNVSVIIVHYATAEKAGENRC